MRRAAALLAVALSALATGCGDSPEAPAPVRPLSDRYGVNAQSLLKLPDAVRRRQVRAIAATGLRAVRLDIPWQELEPSPGRLEAGRLDALIATLAAEGIRVHPVLDYSADWASSVPDETLALPRDPAAFAAFAARVAMRWGSDGSFWRGHPHPRPFRRYEIWNEPNLPDFSRGGVDPARYAALAAAARVAIRRADPNAQIVLAGLATGGSGDGYQTPEDFLRGVIAAQPSLRDVDGVGLHSYAHDTAQTVAALHEMTALLDALGMPGTEVELSEWGVPIVGPGSMPGPIRAAFLGDAARTFAALSCRVGFVALHTWSGSRFAIAAADGSLDPAGKAWVQALARAAPARPCRRAE